MNSDAEREATPEDLVRQFPTCACRRQTCLTCRRGWQFTPRMVASLRFAAALTADDAYDDVEAHAGEPVPEQAWDWAVFDLYPRSTWNAGAAWRRRAARAYDDLAGDINAGTLPIPRCPAEELALHAMLVRLRDWLGDPGAFPTLAQELQALPQHHDDEDFEGTWQYLSLGAEEFGAYPEEDWNPQTAPRSHDDWFKPFQDAEHRDPNRGFRR